ncbi:hypothetical protein [Rhodovulum sulfidophilum]|uniref:hypothetical protein n=1 Tax=Rhodovulum sulfidophilum TaxID=35806 RepID=UPI00117B08DF|nr:hypothetical protein [Rhodovulum sulfidophilum]
MLIVFDTCTKADYYRDVHKVLSAPSGTLVRYDYERRLWSGDAQKLVDRFSNEQDPIPTLLMYGQLKNYKRGDDDPGFMLTWENAFFIPTRVAEVVNVGFDRRGSKDRENIYIHLRLKGFLRPDIAEIETLVGALEERKELPFGQTSGKKWISQCPDDIDSENLLVGTDENWSHVVDAFASRPSQFAGDVFWRITAVRSLNKTGKNAVLIPVERNTNTFGSIDSWHIDFEVDDVNRYVAEVQNYIPIAEDRELPPNAVISAKEDTSKLLLLPEVKINLRRNAAEHLKFGVSPIDFLEKEDAKLIIETEVGNYEGEYPPGSLVEITLRIAKNRVRLAAAVICALVGAVGLVAGATLFRQDSTLGLGVLIGAVVFGYIARWLYTNRIKILK